MENIEFKVSYVKQKGTVGLKKKKDSEDLDDLQEPTERLPGVLSAQNTISIWEMKLWADKEGG